MKRLILACITMLLLLTGCGAHPLPSAAETPLPAMETPLPEATAVALLLLTPAPTSAPAATEPPPAATDEPLPLDAVPLESLWFRYSQLNEVQQQAYRQLYDAAIAWMTENDGSKDFICEITAPGFTKKDKLASVLDSSNAFFFDNPLVGTFFNVMSASEKDGHVVYKFSAAEDTTGTHAMIVEMVGEINVQTETLLSGLRASMSDYEKYRYIADALCESVSYSFTWPKWHGDVYGGMVTKEVVCEGYAYTFQYLCNRAGLWCISVFGWGTDRQANTSELHTWNMIRLDDGYYWVDTTWMDVVGERYFCLTDEQLFLDHEVDAGVRGLPACNATTYAYMGGDASGLSD